MSYPNPIICVLNNHDPQYERKEIQGKEDSFRQEPYSPAFELEILFTHELMYLSVSICLYLSVSRSVH